VFTGLIEELGRTLNVERRGDFQRLEIGADKVLSDSRVGDSVSINGACQTIVDLRSRSLWVESVAETLRLTTLGELRPGDQVNLERALRSGDRLGGHLVLGHIDGVGAVRRMDRRAEGSLLEVVPPEELMPYIAAKGSIAIDGISLTVAALGDASFTIAIIPHTLQHTTLAAVRVGDRTNLEVDVLARYVERQLEARATGSRDSLTLERLREIGY